MPVAAGLSYEVHGRGDGPPLVLSSGLGGAGGYWAPNLAALSARFRVLTYDQRGTGGSARDLQDPLRVEDMADDLLRLLDALGLARVSLVGHALGAHIGFALAAAAPGRLERLVAVNAWAEMDPLTERAFDVRLALLRHAGPEAFFLAQPLFLYPGTWISEHDAELRAEAARQLAHHAGPDALERRIAALRAFRPDLAGVTAPVLCLGAADDMLTPCTASGRLAAALPRGEAATLPWGGHACNVTDPDGFHAAVIPWLDAPLGPA